MSLLLQCYAKVNKLLVINSVISIFGYSVSAGALIINEIYIFKYNFMDSSVNIQFT